MDFYSLLLHGMRDATIRSCFNFAFFCCTGNLVLINKTIIVQDDNMNLCEMSYMSHHIFFHGFLDLIFPRGHALLILNMLKHCTNRVNQPRRMEVPRAYLYVQVKKNSVHYICHQ